MASPREFALPERSRRGQTPSYYDRAYPRTTYGSELDGFAIRFSAVVERDLASFFRHWVYPLSTAAEATIRGFGYQEWLPPGW